MAAHLSVMMKRKAEAQRGQTSKLIKTMTCIIHDVYYIYFHFIKMYVFMVLFSFYFMLDQYNFHLYKVTSINIKVTEELCI